MLHDLRARRPSVRIETELWPDDVSGDYTCLHCGEVFGGSRELLVHSRGECRMYDSRAEKITRATEPGRDRCRS